MNDICKNCNGDKGLHHYETMQCPVGGREANIGQKQEWMTTTYLEDNTGEIEELIKKHLKIALDTDTHVFTDKPQIIVHLLWDGVVIDSDQITLD